MRFAGGGIFGLALLCKVLTLIAIVAPCVIAVRSDFGGRRDRLASLTAFAAGLLAAVAVWEVVQWVSLGGVEYLAGLHARAAFFTDHRGSGASALQHWDSTTLRRNLAELDSILHRSGAAVVAIASAIGLAAATAPRMPRANELALPLVIASLCHGGWWLVVAPEGRPRYLMPALLYAALPVAVLLVRQTWDRKSSAALVGVGIALSGTAEPFLRSFTAHDWFRPSRRVVAMTATSAFLEGLPEPRLLVADWWGTASDLEFLAKTPGRFTPAFLLDPTSLDADTYVVRNERMLSARFESGASLRLAAFAALCDARVVFEHPPYSVLACASDRVQRP